jgi:hypothetical protein
MLLFNEHGVEEMALDPESQLLLDLAAAANRPAWHTQLGRP